MSYKIKLDGFEGPLDLLLHLIEKQELDINDIPIAQITEQYLAYLQAMEQLDLSIASEFLVMGATLLSIKAKMLLPRPSIQAEEGEEPVDPREELIVKLLEYQKYKNVVKELKEKELAQHQVFNHPFNFNGFLADLKPPNPLNNVSPWDLLAVYKQALEAAAVPEPIHEITQETVTVGTQMDYILETLYHNPDGLEFSHLLPDRTSTTRIVVTFLALLELLRLSRIEVYQQTSFGRILIFLNNAGGGQENVVC
ncbi:MAG: segregation/condensation protein A [Clostridia bacterium]|jgi:segregation and condensation protein A|nr:segregation/condensation protein A [Clostridia bacterium]